MDENYTHLSIVLDRSGSMSDVKKDTIGGFNSFLSQQKKVDGKLTVSMVQFDTAFETVYDFVDIKDVVELNDENFVPRGGTALREAICRTMDSVGKKLAALPETKRPAKVLFLVLTDGGENSSNPEYTVKLMESRVKEQTDKYNWKFMFIGADISKFDAKTSYGHLSNQNAAYISKGKMLDALNLVSGKCANFRNAQTEQQTSAALAYSEQELRSLQE